MLLLLNAYLEFERTSSVPIDEKDNKTQQRFVEALQGAVIPVSGPDDPEPVDWVELRYVHQCSGAGDCQIPFFGYYYATMEHYFEPAYRPRFGALRVFGFWALGITTHDINQTLLLRTYPLTLDDGAKGLWCVCGVQVLPPHPRSLTLKPIPFTGHTVAEVVFAEETP